MNMRIWMILGCVLVGSGCSRAFIIEPVAGQVIERGIPDNQLLSIGVCLSGGGYRATVYHLGALWRLNELGMLEEVESITSVSGGSILAGHLGLIWDRLNFVDGVAENFEEEVVRPILSLVSKTVDLPSIVVGALTPSTASKAFASRLNRYLFNDHRLTDFTDTGPRINILSTMLQTQGVWRFSRDSMGGGNFGRLPPGDTQVAHAVAASAAFPPFLAPLTIDISNLPGVERAWRERKRVFNPTAERLAFLEQKGNNLKSISRSLQLGDGGIVNNIGSDGCLDVDIKNAVFVSSASSLNTDITSVRHNWLSVGLKSIDVTYDAKEEFLLQSFFKDERNEGRTVIFSRLKDFDTLDRQIAGNEKVFQVLEALSNGDHFEADWAKKIIHQWRKQPDDVYDAMERSALNVVTTASIRTALKSLSVAEQESILNAGYIIAENSVKDSINRAQNLRQSTPEKSYKNAAPSWIPNYWTAVPSAIKIGSK